MMENETFYGLQDRKCLFLCNKSHLLAQRRGMVVYFVKARHAINDEGSISASQRQKTKPQTIG